jgi:hypothetical protein
MDDEIRKMLEIYSEKTGRKFQFIVEHGIRVAVDTDCRYGGDVPLVDLIAGNGCYKVPEPVAKEWQKLIDEHDELKKAKAALERAALNEQSQ